MHQCYIHVYLVLICPLVQDILHTKKPHADRIHTKNNTSKLSVKKCFKFKQFAKMVCILFWFIKITYQITITWLLSISSKPNESVSSKVQIGMCTQRRLKSDCASVFDGCSIHSQGSKVSLGRKLRLIRLCQRAHQSELPRPIPRNSVVSDHRCT